jgi:large subunit ribosomal protein L10
LPAQEILQQKQSEVQQITELLNKHKVIGIASLQKVRASQMQGFSKNLTNKVEVRVIKNTLMKRAVENCKEKPDLAKLQEHLTGSNVFMFTDLNPFNLAIALEKGKVKSIAKAGDIAASDIVVPTGNTGQSPGPIISQLNAVGLPTRIESGSVWVSKDTLVARKGDVIEEKLASILSKLGIKAVELGIALKVAYDEGYMIGQDQLRVNIDEVKATVGGAYSDAFALSMAIAFPTPETSVPLLQLAHREAYSLSVAAAFPSKETVEDLVRLAHAQMLSLSSRLPSIEQKAKPAEKTEKT